MPQPEIPNRAQANNDETASLRQQVEELKAMVITLQGQVSRLASPRLFLANRDGVGTWSEYSAQGGSGYTGLRGESDEAGDFTFENQDGVGALGSMLILEDYQVVGGRKQSRYRQVAGQRFFHGIIDDWATTPGEQTAYTFSEAVKTGVGYDLWTRTGFISHTAYNLAENFNTSSGANALPKNRIVLIEQIYFLDGDGVAHSEFWIVGAANNFN